MISTVTPELIVKKGAPEKALSTEALAIATLELEIAERQHKLLLLQSGAHTATTSTVPKDSGVVRVPFGPRKLQGESKVASTNHCSAVPARDSLSESADYRSAVYGDNYSDGDDDADKFSVVSSVTTGYTFTEDDVVQKVLRRLKNDSIFPGRSDRSGGRPYGPTTAYPHSPLYELISHRLSDSSLKPAADGVDASSVLQSIAFLETVFAYGGRAPPFTVLNDALQSDAGLIIPTAVNSFMAICYPATKT
jgi:hypothetical protein